MKREIKFRGKQIDTGEWVEGDLLQSSNSKTYVYINPTSSAFVYFDRRQVHPGTVGQFTGLRDKNGVEIYEGDVCLFVITKEQLEYNPQNALTVTIKYDMCCWGYQHTHPEFVLQDDTGFKPFYTEDDGILNMEYFTVIGNIYVNPELTAQ